MSNVIEFPDPNRPDMIQIIDVWKRSKLLQVI